MLTAAAGMVATRALPPQLDRVRMRRASEGLMAVLGSYLPAGCHEWAELHRPDVARYLNEGRSAVETASKSGSSEEFIDALRVCLGHHQKAKRIYGKERRGGIVHACATRR